MSGLAQWLTNLPQRLPRGAVLLAGISVLSVVLGFAREAVIAFYFGASAQLDAFLVALSLPRLLGAQVGVLTTAVVLPRYIAHREQGRPEVAAALMQHWTRFLLLAATVICVALALISGPLIGLIGPGLSEAARDDAAGWLRGLLPYLWLTIVAGGFKAVLDSHRRFASPAMAGALISLGVILACVLLTPIMNIGGLIWGFVGGALVAFAWQWLSANRVEKNVLSLRRHSTASIRLPFSGAALMLANSVALQMSTLIDRAFASGLPEGSIAALNYASAIVSVPRTVVASALATALFPVLAAQVARRRADQAFKTAAKWAVVILVFGIVPVALLIVFRTEVIAVLFQRGAFDSRAAAVTAQAMALLPVMIIVNGMSVILARLLVALNRLALVAVAGIGGLLLKILFNSLLVGPLGLTGLVLATVLSGSLMLLARLVFAWRASRVDSVDSRPPGDADHAP